MRVCMTHYAFFPTTGGVESHLYDLCTELVRQGYEVYALVGSLEGSPDYEEMDGVKIFRRELMNPEIVREMKAKEGKEADELWPEMQARVHDMYRDFAREHSIDVIHAHNFHHFLPEHGMALTDIRSEMKTPTYLTIHEVWKEFLCEELLQKTVWDAVITVSEHVKKGIYEQAPHLDNLKLIYHGIDVEQFSPHSSVRSPWVERLNMRERPIVLHPARMLPWKGAIYSVEAMPLVLEKVPNAALIITDTEEIVDWINELPGYKRSVHEKVDQLGLRDHVVSQSFEYTELPAIYNATNVTIYPTIGEEPFGLVPVEAMACGVPAIVTRSGGLVESVIDNVTGYVIEKKDPQMLADRIVRLLTDKDLAAEMGRRGREHAVKNFSRQRMAREVADLYKADLAAAPQRALAAATER